MKLSYQNQQLFAGDKFQTQSSCPIFVVNGPAVERLWRETVTRKVIVCSRVAGYGPGPELLAVEGSRKQVSRLILVYNRFAVEWRSEADTEGPQTVGSFGVVILG